MLGEPFNALLLEELSRTDYSRIASFSFIVIGPADVTGILRGKVWTLSVYKRVRPTGNFTALTSHLCSAQVRELNRKIRIVVMLILLLQ